MAAQRNVQKKKSKRKNTRRQNQDAIRARKRLSFKKRRYLLRLPKL